MNDMGYVSDRLTGIMRVSDMVRKMEAEELTQKERDLLATETLEGAQQKFPELSAKATAIFQRAVAAVEAQDQEREQQEQE